jgi:6-pyruvoyltetrahydropterin/6-carboxytetrahydropterin synthase
MSNTYIYKIYEFSSAHRLKSNKLSETENLALFGSCFNSYGHGHNYVLEVGVSGKIDEDTGMLINLVSMDKTVKNIINELDNKNLNCDIAFFRNNVSSGENIINYLWSKLDKEFHQKILYHLKLWETNNNYFEIMR